MYGLLDRAFKAVLAQGTLRVTGPDGVTRSYGDGTGSPVHLLIKTTAGGAQACRRRRPLSSANATWTAASMSEGRTIYDVLALLMANVEANKHAEGRQGRLCTACATRMKRIDQYNPVGKAKNNVAHHYDLSGALYDLFLDRDRQYSCAYFETDDGSLEDAQLAKKRHLAAKLDIKPGMKVLDIGSGWGGLGLYLAEICGAEVTGVTLSEEQHKLSNERAAAARRRRPRAVPAQGLPPPRPDVRPHRLGRHVRACGRRPLQGVLRQGARTCSADDGVAVLHSINRSDGPGATSAWIKKYIFPGGYIPALSEVLPHIESAGLYVTDIEILRLHYAETLREWARRFADHRDRAKELYDERFCRMWEFYLAASECAFRYRRHEQFPDPVRAATSTPCR